MESKCIAETILHSLQQMQVDALQNKIYLKMSLDTLNFNLSLALFINYFEEEEK